MNPYAGLGALVDATRALDPAEQAELHLEQGFVERALAIYASLADDHPEVPFYRHRRDWLRRVARSGEVAPRAPSASTSSASTSSASSSSASTSSASTPSASTSSASAPPGPAVDEPEPGAGEEPAIAPGAGAPAEPVRITPVRRVVPRRPAPLASADGTLRGFPAPSAPLRPPARSPRAPIRAAALVRRLAIVGVE